MSKSATTNVLATLGHAEEKPAALRVAEALAASVASALETRHEGTATLITLPDGYRVEDITALVEKTQPARNRPQGIVGLGDVPSLLAYCADQVAQERGYIYADPDSRTITAVFNDQRSTLFHGWRDHRAVFAATFTPEFKKWLEQSGKPMSQQEFSEFIEDNYADLNGEDGQTLLNVATTIQATTGINFSSARRLQDGQSQLTYNEVIDAKAGSDGALKIPQTFTLGVRIFKNGDGYKLTARLKYRLAGGGVKFWYELDRPERAVEDAFNGYVQTVREKTGYTVLTGKP
ncbi:DUF2303 family protein [Paracidovorax wautersii]|uniref:DUF2303 family protein n=1 Tax=Paracidovorax wautersii TaxID=1177982 RepID=UPI0031D8974A